MLLRAAGVPVPIGSVVTGDAEEGWQAALDELERYWFAAGERLFHGQGAVGVPIHLERARLCYRKAGELGHRRAAFMLAECLRHGLRKLRGVLPA